MTDQIEKSKYHCIHIPLDYISVEFHLKSQVRFRSKQSDRIAAIALSRDQIQSLRDQLTAWLEDGLNPAQDERKVTMQHVLKAYQLASFQPAPHLRGTSNWCAYVADQINRMRAEEKS